MICADFLAGASLQGGDPEVLYLSILRLLEMLPAAERQRVIEKVGTAA